MSRPGQQCVAQRLASLSTHRYLASESLTFTCPAHTHPPFSPLPGIFETAEEAARAYDRESLRLNGRGAITNFPLSGEHLCLPPGGHAVSLP